MMSNLRLRNVFQYPGDSEIEPGREELDEEEQENTINQLYDENEKRNKEYKVAFSLLSFISIIPFVYEMLLTTLSTYERLLCISSIISLILTSYMMSHQLWQNLALWPLNSLQTKKTEAFITSKILSSLNAMICGCLVLGVYLIEAMGWPCNSHLLLFLTPGAMLIVALIVQALMHSIDINHLQSLRYAYKGA
ncbi:hypothetical protein ASPZODRAFT_745802 [Penicilliopsis zonata CBS 506.65]|uniref:Uncharacterized protein n=1 Tax=Penicilliopsis zonata CBS 506.65 TaxID=1073090 RepID=A0A1L9SCC8_9EURO|nr:hypothetical protein ASPZODRAFT_745802 [Penicilliopsis zonata CBS 506.65]OJJ44831.1 hypothetical protein ASPZODRAFT_745802 [Penicilliopsis zonata CBS 506.65]